MKFKKMAVAITLTAISTLAFAENFRGEVGLGYSDVEGTDIKQIFGELHFGEVSTSGHALEEAGYLEKSNNIQLVYTDFGNGYDITAVQLEFYLNSFYIAPGYLSSSEGDDNGLDVGFVKLGWANDKGLRIHTTVPEDDYDANISVKYVTTLAGGNLINIEGGYAAGDDDADDMIIIGVDYYFDETFSVGAQFINREDSYYGLSANKFFNDSVRVGVSYSPSGILDITHAPDGVIAFGDGFNTITLDASVRF